MTEEKGDQENVYPFGKARDRRRRKSSSSSAAPDPEHSQSGCEMRVFNGGSRSGLYCTAKSEDGIWLCQPFEVAGICLAPEENNEPARTVGILVRFQNMNKRDDELILMSDVLQSDLGRFGQVLYEVGFVFDRSDATKKPLQRYLANFACSRRVLVVPRTGWFGANDETEGFMLPREVIAIAASDHPPILAPSARTARHSRRGTFEQWRDNSARLAGQHMLGVFRMSAALASPLLRLASQEGGVFHLWGISSCGKTTLDLLAATVWGKGSREGGFSRTWSSTVNGFEGTAAAGNDLGVFLDDTSHVIDVRSIIPVIYMVSGGQGKTRSRADTSQREPLQFRIIVNSNGEAAIPATLKEARIPVKGGVGVRCVDIAAVGVGKESPDTPGAAFDAHMSDWPSYVEKAAEAAVLAYGHAGPMFVRKLIEEKIDYKFINDLVAGFVKRCDVGQSGQLRRVATKIGLVAAAGELAIKFGIFPWPPGSALEAADFVFKGWLDRRGSKGSTEMQQALEGVQLLFEKHGDTRFDFLSGDESSLTSNTERPFAQNRLGWTTTVKAERRWYLSAQTWKQEICKGFDVRALISELEKRGALEMEVQKDGRKRPPKVVINGLRGRYYTITPRIFSVVSDDPDA
jgi:hypothetical protein